MNARITRDHSVMLGKPCIVGTRITVEHILEELAAGATVEALLEAHPRLVREDVQAALRFAVESVRLERLSQISATS